MAISRSTLRTSGLAGVVADDVADGVFSEIVSSSDSRPAFSICLGRRIPQRDVQFLVFGISREPDDLHAIEQRRRNVQCIRSGDEHDVREVVVDFEIVIVECVILLGIEHFKQRRGRIASEIHRHLVNLVKQEQRVSYSGLREILNDLSRKCANVGTSMASNLCFVADTAQRHPDELAVGRSGNRLTEGGLADSGCSYQTEDGGP